MFGHLAKAAGVRALLVDYRLLPEGGRDRETARGNGAGRPP
jgi:acetyl esterase/lipase